MIVVGTKVVVVYQYKKAKKEKKETKKYPAYAGCIFFPCL